MASDVQSMIPSALGGARTDNFDSLESTKDYQGLVTKRFFAPAYTASHLIAQLIVERFS